MKKRARVKVLGQWIRIEHVPSEQMEGCLGFCIVEKRLIQLDASLEGDEYKRVLKHEITHMKHRISGLIEMMSPELDEALAVLSETE